MHKIIVATLVFCLFGLSAQAQYSATKKAQYLAVVKAVANYKIEDAETSADVESLRQNRMFMEKLQKMLDKLSNERTKDSTNRRVLQILENTGERLYNLLD